MSLLCVDLKFCVDLKLGGIVCFVLQAHFPSFYCVVIILEYK